MSHLVQPRRRFALQGLWRHPDFLKLWLGQTVSSVGSQVTSVALPLAAALTLQITPVQMGFLGALTFAPSLLFGLFAGVWIDQRRKRPVLLIADLSRAVLLGSIPVAALFGWLRLEQLYVVGFCTGVLTVFFEIAYMSFLPLLVSRAHLVEGNSKLQISYAVAQLAGPGLAGWIVQVMTAPLAIMYDACSFLISALSFWLIRTPEPPPQPRNTQIRMWHEIGGSLRMVLLQPLLRPLIACQMTDSLFSAMLFAVYTLFLTRDLGLSPATYGLLLMIFAPGSIIGALLVGPLGRRFGIGATMISGQLLIAAGFVLRSVASGSSLQLVVMLIVANLAVGCGNRLYSIHQVSLQQSITPANAYGRVSASIRFLNSATTPLGAIIGGLVGQWLGLRPTIIVAAIGIALSTIWLVLSPVRTLKEMPAEDEDQVPQESIAE